MVKLIKEDIDGIRYCVISRYGNSRFYIVEKFCDSLQDARDTAEQYLDNYPEDESWGNEYWVFDTKKWKPCYSPANDPFNVFNSNIPIYRNDNGKAELLADYIGRRVNDYTGRWKKESYKKNVRENFELSDNELDLVYDIADRYCTSSPVSGSWDTERVHEMNAISDELGITPEEAKQVMIDYLGFEEDMFIESVKPVNEEDLKDQIYAFLDELGGYADYNQKVEDVMDEFGLDRDDAEGYVWSYTSGVEGTGLRDEYLYDEDEDDDYFDEGCHVKKSRKGRKGLKKESESMMPDYTENGSYCIWCYNELDADFGYDPGPQIVEDNLTQEYAEARAEELNATSEPFMQYWAERERERYW